MPLKDLDQLRAEIDAAVHPNGPLGKTTAPGLNALLRSFAAELTALSSAPMGSFVIIEQNLASRSAENVPSVAAVVAALSASNAPNDDGVAHLEGSNSFSNTNAFSNRVDFSNEGQYVTSIYDGDVEFEPNGRLGWRSEAALSAGIDAAIMRESAGVLKVVSGESNTYVQLKAADVLATAAPDTLNSIGKLAQYIISSRADLEAIRTTVPATAARAAGYTLQLADAGQQVPIDSPAAGDVIVPTDSLADFRVGAILEVSQENTGQVTITGQPGVTIQAPSGAVRTAQQYAVVGLRKVAPNVWRVQGGVS